MLGESKSEIFEIIPKKYLPKWKSFDSSTSVSDVKSVMQSLNLVYPIILKPDIGERGWMVKKISNDQQLQNYLDQIKVKFILQEYLDYEVELGVFYYRYPDQEKGIVSSIVAKELLSVTGDGTKTLEDLIIENPRARFQLETLKQTKPTEFFEKILGDGDKIELVSIGNHCLGTKFLNGNDWIDEQLNESFDQLSKSIPDFYFGRFDLRCESIEKLRKLEGFKIMELNGAGAEPGHIYQPGFSLWEAYKVIFHHIRVLSDISRINHKFGHPYWSFKRGMAKIREIKRYNKQK